MENEFKISDLHSGYLVEFRNGRRAIVARAGSFTKVLVDPSTREWWYLSSGWADKTLKARFQYPSNQTQAPRLGKCNGWDIVKIWGLCNRTGFYGSAFETATYPECRSVLWERKATVKMTVAQICEKLGYDIEIIKEDEQ